MAYSLELPKELNQIHIIFHVSQLRKCVVDDSIVAPLDDIQVDECVDYMERPVAILDRKTKALCNKSVPLVKVQWRDRKGLERTWEPENEICTQYPEYCLNLSSWEFQLLATWGWRITATWTHH